MKFSLQALTRSPISLVGVAIATASSILIITLILLTFFGMEGGPYLGILAFVILPIIFVVFAVIRVIAIVKGLKGDRFVIPWLSDFVDKF